MMMKQTFTMIRLGKFGDSQRTSWLNDFWFVHFIVLNLCVFKHWNVCVLYTFQTMLGIAYGFPTLGNHGCHRYLFPSSHLHVEVIAWLPNGLKFMVLAKSQESSIFGCFFLNYLCYLFRLEPMWHWHQLQLLKQL